MRAPVQVTIDPSQFPDQVRSELLKSLRRRQINHKFLYEGVSQTEKWLALHEAYSPARTDPDCQATYERAFKEAIRLISQRMRELKTADASPKGKKSQQNEYEVHLIGLGCGGGQKDARLLELLTAAGNEVAYTPVDVSTAMVLVARERVTAFVPSSRCYPVVLDLATTKASPALFAKNFPQAIRLISFFGMIPNFEPQLILPKLTRLVGPGDWLLLSANLAPGSNYEQGVKKIRPLYDNKLTREWLMEFLQNIGIEKSDGQMLFRIEEMQSDGTSYRRIAAHFCFKRTQHIRVESTDFDFKAGESLRLFFSYRYTPGLLRSLLAEYGLKVRDQWITKSREEGVFLLEKTTAQ